VPKLAAPKTDIAFRNAKPRSKPYSIADGGGLSLLIQPTGSKLWIFRYRRPTTGRPNSISFGPYPDILPSQARDKAQEARNNVRDGIDPHAKRLEQRAAVRRHVADNFRKMARDWLESKRKEWATETYRKAEYVVDEYLIPSLKDTPVSTLATKDVKPVLTSIFAKAPNLAAKARQYLGGIVVFAIQAGIREDGKLLVTHGLLPKHEKGNIPAITKPSEIGPLVRAIAAYDSPITRMALQLAMLTAMRPGIIASAPWREIDTKNAEWHVPGQRMKTRHDHIVPLPRQALTLLEELGPLSGNGDWLFPSPARQKSPHLSRDTLSKALRDMGFQGKHATHGFRGMLRTVGRERLGIDIDVLEAQLAHAKRGDVQKAYDRTTFDDDRRRVMQEWADYLEMLAAEEDSKSSSGSRGGADQAPRKRTQRKLTKN
jgi:integrase